MSLRVCGACRRHVRESTCPFCGAAVASAPPRPVELGRVSRAAVFAGGLLGGCYTDHPAPQAPPPPHVEQQQQEQQFAKPPDDTATSAASGTIEGAITDTSGASIGAGYRVTLQFYRSGAEVRQVAETDASGHYAFANLAAGTYTVSWASGDPRRQGSFDVMLGEHDKKTVNGSVARFTGNHLPTPYGAPPARRRVV